MPLSVCNVLVMVHDIFKAIMGLVEPIKYIPGYLSLHVVCSAFIGTVKHNTIEDLQQAGQDQSQRYAKDKYGRIKFQSCSNIVEHSVL